jgi:outer membrane protein TolC
MPMITATLPIYRKKYIAQQREAGFFRDAAGESAANAKNELTVSFQESVEQLKDAERRVELNKRQASLAEKTVTLLTSSFSTAGTDFEEILRMQQQLLDYQYKHIEAMVDRNTAIARLLSIISYN